MNAKTLTLAGAVVLIIGLFLPIASVMGISTNLIMPPGQGVTASGLILAGCAVLAAILALIGQPKWAVIPGIGAVGWLVFQFLEAQKQLSGGGFMDWIRSISLPDRLTGADALLWVAIGIFVFGLLILRIRGRDPRRDLSAPPSSMRRGAPPQPPRRPDLPR